MGKTKIADGINPHQGETRAYQKLIPLESSSYPNGWKGTICAVFLNSTELACHCLLLPGRWYIFLTTYYRKGWNFWWFPIWVRLLLAFSRLGEHFELCFYSLWTCFDFKRYNMHFLWAFFCYNKRTLVTSCPVLVRMSPQALKILTYYIYFNGLTDLVFKVDSTQWSAR